MQTFDCKEPGCPHHVTYDRPPGPALHVLARRNGAARPTGGVRRPYLDCPDGHSYRYEVRVDDDAAGTGGG